MKNTIRNILISALVVFFSVPAFGQVQDFFDTCKAGTGAMLGSYQVLSSGKIIKNGTAGASLSGQCRMRKGKYIDVIHGAVLAQHLSSKGDSYNTAGYGIGLEWNVFALSLIAHYELGRQYDDYGAYSISPSISVNGKDLLEFLVYTWNATIE